MRKRKNDKKTTFKIDITGLTIEDQDKIQSLIDSKLGVAETLVKNDYIHRMLGRKLRHFSGGGGMPYSFYILEKNE